MNNKEKELSTRDTILKITLNIIKKEGIESITIRKIAKEANINVALINYHFGSKDNLINEALKILIKDMEQLFNTLENDEIEPKKKLKLFLLGYVEILGENTSIIKKAMADTDKLFQSQLELLKFVNQMGFGKIKHLIKQITKIEDDKFLTFTMFQLVGSIFFPMMALPLVEKGGPIEYKFSDDIEGYIDILIDNFFKEY